MKAPARGLSAFSPSPDACASPSPLKGEGISCHAELVSASRIFPPSCHTGLVPHCHAELVSASHIFHKQRQADKWNNKILKQVQDDIFFLSSFLGLTREPGQTIAPVIASGAKQSGLSPRPHHYERSEAILSVLRPRHCEQSEAIQSDNLSLRKTLYIMIQIASAFPSLAMTWGGEGKKE